MTVTIIPLEDHRQYNVNGHTVYLDSNNRYISRTELSPREKQAFHRYKTTVIDNPRFKTHTKATYKTK